MKKLRFMADLLNCPVPLNGCNGWNLQGAALMMAYGKTQKPGTVHMRCGDDAMIHELGAFRAVDENLSEVEVGIMQAA